MADRTDSDAHEKETNLGRVRAQKSLYRLCTRALKICYTSMVFCFGAWAFCDLLGLYNTAYWAWSVLGLLGSIVLIYVFAGASWRSDHVLTDNGFVKDAIITPLVIVFFGMLTELNLGGAYSQATRYDARLLKEVGNSLIHYKDARNGQFPEPNSWCDDLVDDHYTFPYSNRKSCPYTMNEQAAGLGHEAPGNMVWIFESAPGWNQVGGPDMVRANARGRVNILFMEGLIKTIKVQQVPYLRWHMEDSGIMPTSDLTRPFPIQGAAMAGAVCLVCMSILLGYRQQARKYWLGVLILGCASAGIGLYFGKGAERLPLYSYDGSKSLGGIIGGLCGLAFGIAYVPVLGRLYDKTRPGGSAMGYGTLTGIFTGAACSTLVHAFLMMAYEEKTHTNMLIGLGFGAAAGAMLGWIGGVMMSVYYREHELKPL